MALDPQLMAQQQQAQSQAMLLGYLMSSNLEGIKQALEGPNPPSLDPNWCLHILSYNDNEECIKYIIPMSDPTHNHSEALRTAVQYCNPTTVALLLPVSALKDCQDVLCEIADQAMEDPSEEWLKALSVCLNIAPHWSFQALRTAMENNCETVAHILYPYVHIESMQSVIEQTAHIETHTRKQISTRFNLDAIKDQHAHAPESLKRI